MLNEVRPNLSISLAVKAAEAQFSGSHRTYTHISTDASHHRAGGDSHHKKRHDSHKKSTSAGDNKKDDKKSRSKNNRQRSHRSTSGDEVATLRNEIAEVREENSAIRKELEDLRLLVQKSQIDWVLILGDGNLSYSYSFALKNPKAHITSTVFEDEKTFVQRYSRKFVDKLKQMAPRVRLKFGVDATSLTKEFVHNFRFVIMNFPHPGGKNNTKQNRDLLHRIFRCQSRALRTRTLFLLTLRASQIGLNLEPLVQIPPPHQLDSWRAVYSAADNELFLDSIKQFEYLDDYKSSGYKNQNKFFHNDNALTLLLHKVRVPSNLQEAVRLETRKKHSMFCRLHPYFVRDISVLYRASFEQKDEDFILKYIQDLTGKLVVKLEELRDLSCIYNGKANRIYDAATDYLTVGDNSTSCQKAGPSKAAKEETPAKDEDFDLFGSDDEEESAEAKRIKEERLAAYAAKKAKKPGPIAKSSVILDVKPWDDETSLDEMEKLVKSIEMDGLLWGATKKVPIGYGISKLQIVCTVEDEKVSIDDLSEKITEFEDHVQSVDIVAFNKI
ncbi:hypothetical protein M3Y97_00452800 [Aphelenchoides bicaudatus]|nr:hypothetical protein M3Y97_00452800 [Aphelenchoides bicaudatus]